MRSLPCALVIDHVGKFLEPVAAPDPPGLPGVAGARRRRTSTYVKLSAPYEVSKVGPPLFDDVSLRAKALVEAAPERMLWASNWPHLAAAERHGDEAQLLDLLLDWAPEEFRPPHDPRRQSGASLRILRRSMPRHRIAIIGLGMAVTRMRKSLLDLEDRVEVAYAFSPRAARRALSPSAFRFRSPPTRDVLSDASVDASHPDAAEHASRSCAARRGGGKARAARKAGGDHDGRARTTGGGLPARRSEARRRAAAPLPAGRRGASASLRRASLAPSPALDGDPPLAPAELLRRAGPRHHGARRRRRPHPQGIHTLDLMLSLAGASWKCGPPSDDAAPSDGDGGSRCRRRRFENGALGTIKATTAAYPGFPERIEVIAERRRRRSWGRPRHRLSDGRSDKVEPNRRRRHRRRPDGFSARPSQRADRRFPRCDR